MKQIASLTFHLRGLWKELPYQGLHVPVTGSHVTKPVWKAIWRQIYERPEILALNGLMRPDDRVLELGAGMGLVSGSVARRFPTATFVSYEANPQLAEPIRQLHRRNGLTNVDLRSAIVAPLTQGDRRTFRLHQHFSESSLVSAAADQGTVEVAVHDPTAVMAEIAPTVLVCDIEGGEEELLPVLPMGGLRAAVVELHPKIVSRQGMKRIFDAFQSAGLTPVIELSSATVVAFERVDTP